MTDFFSQLSFLFQRLNWLSLLDLALVTLVFFVVLLLVRDTQAMVLLRGLIFLAIGLMVLTSLVNLPAFSWLIQAILPSLLLAIPVIFAPEIRRGLERIGRAGSTSYLRTGRAPAEEMKAVISAVVTAAARLSGRQHGALIVMQRGDNLSEYMRSGVQLQARVTPELLLQIFYPNTPLHDGAAIIADNKIYAAACVMPLSASGVLNSSPDRQMGLRHRAAMGISEASDAIAVVVSEETGAISIAHDGHMIRRLDTERLENILLTFFPPPAGPDNLIKMLWHWLSPPAAGDKRKERK